MQAGTGFDAALREKNLLSARLRDQRQVVLLLSACLYCQVLYCCRGISRAEQDQRQQQWLKKAI